MVFRETAIDKILKESRISTLKSNIDKLKEELQNLESIPNLEKIKELTQYRIRELQETLIQLENNIMYLKGN